MVTIRECQKCKGRPRPRKLETVDLWVCECDCGWTCVGDTPDKAAALWNKGSWTGTSKTV